MMTGTCVTLLVCCVTNPTCNGAFKKATDQTSIIVTQIANTSNGRDDRCKVLLPSLPRKVSELLGTLPLVQLENMGTAWKSSRALSTWDNRPSTVAGVASE